jgi:sec-independent protein translocase protein TatC
MSEEKKDDAKLALPAKDSEPPDKGTMTFWEHLEELRARIIKAALAVVAAGFGAWFYRLEIMAWLTKPLVEGWIKGTQPELHFPSPADLFICYIKISAIGGLVFASPIVFYQLWAFIAPGLYAREKRLAVPFVLSSTLLFVGGAYFGWRFAFPMAMKYLLSFSGQVGEIVIKPTIMVTEYINFVTRLLLAFGAAFELPVVVFFLAIMGVVTHKQLLKFSRYFIVLAFFISAIITPPDALSQLMLALPLCGLYFLSIFIAWLVQRKKPPNDPPSDQPK